ncbi:ABC transporter substrate-binding protein [Brachyspira sp.]|uniref:ABC transporter substrate-binding protein n=1 Tax=Brachyspira sp. TaxID=1977261 RepID=UPI003D7E8114
MKKLNLIILFIAALILSCGDKTKSENSNASSDSKKIVLITMDSIDEHWLSVRNGAEDKVKELGNIELIFRAPAGKTDPNEQTRMAEDAINQKADAILLAPSDPAALAPVAAKIKEANIPLILIDSALSTEDYDAFFSTDNEAAGALAGETFAKLVNGRGKIGIVHAQPSSTTAIARGKGFETKIKEIAPNIQVVSVQYSDGDKARALNIATDIMTANPDLVGFFTSNEGSTIGVARAIEDMGKKDSIMLVGFDKSQDTIRALENGTLKATIVQNPYKMGYEGIQTAVDILEGKEVSRLTDTGVNVVTLENIDTIK